MSLHIGAEKGQIAKAVILPGDPLRAKFVAENFLTSPVKYSEIRNMYGFTGLYKGVPVSIQGTGMGMPSMGIYSWELMTEYGCERLIRMGTCASFAEDVNIGDVLMAIAASTDSNYQHTFGLNGQFSPTASFSLVEKAIDVGRETGIKFIAGNVLSSDMFYEANPEWWKPWARMGIKGVEMEVAALYMNAAFHHVDALGMFTVSDNFATGAKATVEARQNSFTDMMTLALETATR